jgi:predicted AAA+ superfamily ATPase
MVFHEEDLERKARSRARRKGERAGRTASIADFTADAIKFP